MVLQSSILTVFIEDVICQQSDSTSLLHLLQPEKLLNYTWLPCVLLAKDVQMLNSSFEILCWT